MKYNLVSTKVEEVTSTSEELLLLDHFCLDDLVGNYINKNYNVVKSYGYDEKIMKNDFEIVKKFASSFMIELSKVLNENHKINYSNRQWQILLSFWLHRTITILFNRFNKIEKTFNENIISSVTLYKNEINDLISFKTSDISDNSRILYWNNIIYDEIIKFKKIDVKINYIQNKIKEHSFYINQNSLLKKSKAFIKNLINQFNKKNIENSISFIFESYLPKEENEKLIKYYKQPNIYLPDYTPDNNIDYELRDKLSSKLDKKVNSEFEKFVKKIFFKLFPVCYLENFNDLKSKCDDAILPINPKFIFTSNAFDTNELFKMYVCKKINNTKYFAGQHGGATPIWNYSVIDTYLFDHVDGFFNWGWENKGKNYSSFLLPKLSTKKKMNKNSKKISLMLRPVMHQNVTWDRYQEVLLSFKKNAEFIKDCKKFDFNKKLFIRGYPQVSCKLNNRDNWKKYVKIKNYDDGDIPFDEYKDDCELNIFPCESTGFFQLININKPAIILFHSFDKDIKDNYKNDFKKLAEVGIIHFENETLINHLNNIYQDIPKWWNSSSVQEKLKPFMEKYASNKKDYNFLIEKMHFQELS